MSGGGAFDTSALVTAPLNLATGRSEELLLLLLQRQRLFGPHSAPWQSVAGAQCLRPVFGRRCLAAFLSQLMVSLALPGGRLAS